MQLPGTLHCWQHFQSISKVVIPEGLCLHILSTAAKHGDPALATSVFNALSKMEVQFGAQHFLPLIEAYTRCGDIQQAFIVIGIMRSSCLSPPQTSQLRFLVEKIGESAESLDEAFFILQDIVQKQ